MQPIDRTLGYVFGHALHFIVEGPAVVAIEIALEFRKQIGDERVKVTCRYARADVGKQPALHGVIDLAGRPLALCGRSPIFRMVNGSQELGMLRENGIGKALPIVGADQVQRARSKSVLGLGQQLV